ncbi:3'(2'),5'-bisphosphate nucleotidase CysQ [Winogradskyella sp.]|nr:3'(2'),5'-bisphosphate nucleotidase CysQ [Winogradskyella sp.]MDC0006866.1 3'(2'),5'-bisphosphate nucleotidase CysQ [Winogradskyella sp.]MDC1503669.1 3'(2'),5'-bisphosphate nucleotidase CysQ [Winogradskyella sp.]
MSGIKVDKNLATAIAASLKAGEVIMQVYNTPFDVEIKDDKSPLTEADKKANDIINSYLIETPIPIISEENKQTDYAIRKNWQTCWVVDPVDGTKEFIKRNGEFTVNIALITNGIPKLGVIYMPTTKTLYFADVTRKLAYKAQLSSHSTALSTILEVAEPLKPKANNTDFIEVVGSRSHMSAPTLDYISSIEAKGRKVEIVSKGSSLKFCLIAEGSADIYPRFAPTMEWDTAAGQAICNAVGINVISQDTNESLQYNKEHLLNPWFIVSK